MSNFIKINTFLIVSPATPQSRRLNYKIFSFFFRQINITRVTASLTEPIMFANIFLLSLLTIIYGTKGDEGGGGGATAESNFLPDISQQHSSGPRQLFVCCLSLAFISCVAFFFFMVTADLNFIKTPRSIRTPFRNTEIMTARGFGKRDREEQEYNEES